MLDIVQLDQLNSEVLTEPFNMFCYVERLNIILVQLDQLNSEVLNHLTWSAM
jgi:hypothetical protein